MGSDTLASHSYFRTHDYMKQRIIGFDLARAYAIFGMFIVNFNFSFGSLDAPTGPMGHFLNTFTGNSTAIFILCAGMGVSLMTNRPAYSREEQAALKSKVLKRSWFLFALGLLLYPWWSGDILHFYGGYMHMAAFLLFVPSGITCGAPCSPWRGSTCCCCSFPSARGGT